MELIQEITLLKESFLEFICKVTPVLTEPILEQFNSKWNPLKKLLSDPSKRASDIFLLVSSMSSLKKSNTSSTSATSPNSDCSSQKTQKTVNQVKKCNELPEQREITKVKEQANPLLYKELKIEINKKFYPNTPRSRPTLQQESVNNGEKLQEEDIKAKILRDDIKFLNQLRAPTHEKKVSVTIRCNLGLKLSDAISQFRRDNFTLKTIHERSNEITTPESPKKERSESPLLVIQRPTNQYFQQPVFVQQQQAGALKGYSIYSKKGYIQPIQFDAQFQMLMQQYQNNIIYKKLYF
ncbi:unnamed protein product [Paramecium sonneborni]|uniref:Uncharacterized protein n=1 Tax=Paramecium sonneborni TaxID=65129 RepID=A0A8S1N3E0_9CILI|nr:unnamed protein product [Paramecium sonneborni]CAD8084601.1 unnamed protein product [Paramecium sonneborni]